MLKKIFVSIIILMIVENVKSQNISVMTYNVRYGLADDGKNSWEFRKDFLASQIKFYNPDFIGTQESLPFQLAYIDSKLPDHSFIGKSRDKDSKGEYSAILYNHQKFELIKENTFWLSATPNQPSKSWDAAYPRICTYGLFIDKKTKNKFWIINTHLDHIGVTARKKSVDLILKKIKDINIKNYPLVFMGDLNTEAGTEPILKLKTVLNDTKDISIEKSFGPTGTFNAFKFNKPVTRTIDYIFVSKNNKIKVLKHAVLTDSKDLKYPSDHLPVYVVLSF